MHDDHTFTKIEGDMARIRIAALALAIESTYGMLCPVILLADNVELRRVGVGQHAGPEGLTDKQFNEWRASVLADADAARLLADVGSAVQG
jgi:hypothetical protein